MVLTVLIQSRALDLTVTVTTFKPLAVYKWKRERGEGEKWVRKKRTIYRNQEKKRQKNQREPTEKLKVISWRASSSSISGSSGLQGLLSVACLLISSPHGPAWPWKLISGTCSTPRPLGWPVPRPTLAAACSPRHRHAGFTPVLALPYCAHSAHTCTHMARRITEGLRCHVRGRGGEYVSTLVGIIIIFLHMWPSMFTFTHQGTHRLRRVNMRGGVLHNHIQYFNKKRWSRTTDNRDFLLLFCQILVWRQN